MINVFKLVTDQCAMFDALKDKFRFRSSEYYAYVEIVLNSYQYVWYEYAYNILNMYEYV